MRVHHLALRTDDVDGLAEFYQRHFALAVVRRSPTSVWLALDEGSVLMIEARSSGEPRPTEGSMELLAFRGTDAEHAALRAVLVEEGRLEAETGFTVYFRDPDGRRVACSVHPLR